MTDIHTQIRYGPSHEVRTVLNRLCKEPTTKRRAMMLFKKLFHAAKIRQETDEPPITTWICFNCDAYYNDEQNPPGTCHYHPGIMFLNPSSPSWSDYHDADVRDLEVMRADNHGGFDWDCCGAAGDGPGCTVGRHKQGGTKKPRTSSSSLPASSVPGSEADPAPVKEKEAGKKKEQKKLVSVSEPEPGMQFLKKVDEAEVNNKRAPPGPDRQDAAKFLRSSVKRVRSVSSVGTLVRTDRSDRRRRLWND